MRLFFTSDTHFGDARRIRIDKRPFASIAEHDAGLIARWNETVGPNDEVWHLGDVAPNHDSAAVKQLLTSRARTTFSMPPAAISSTARATAAS